MVLASFHRVTFSLSLQCLLVQDSPVLGTAEDTKSWDSWTGVVQRVELLLVLLASHIRVLVPGPAALLPIQLPAAVPGKAAKGGPSAWSPSMGDPDGVSGFCLWPGPDPVIEAI